MHQAAPIVYAILQALSEAHRQGVVHRDLKPDNVFLVRDPAGRFTVKVLDFGIAKVMDAAGGMTSKTKTGMLLGTPGYMSPEQIKNAKGVDPRSDLWSVGIIFYEMLTGREAFDAATEFAKLTAVLTSDPVPIDQVNPQLVGWREFFVRALSREPDQRFQTADDMAQALLAIAKGGAMPVPTAEFSALAIPSAALPQAPGAPRVSTAMSPQPTTGAPPPMNAPAVQIVHSGPSLDSTLREGLSPLASMPPPKAAGVPGWLVAILIAVTLALGFAAGFFVGRS